MSRVLTIGLCLLVVGSVAFADFVGYAPTSENEMPGTGWALGGVDPIRREVPAGSGVVVSAEGIAHIDCDNTTSRWTYAGSGLVSSTGFTVDFKTEDLLSSSSNTGCAFGVVADNFQVVIKVLGQVGVDEDASRLEFIWLDGGADVYTSAVADRPDLDYFNTWRFAVLGNNFSVYVNDQVAAVATGTLDGRTASHAVSDVSFGDWGSSTNGNADLDYVVWDNSQAIFAAPIPEPMTLSLLLAGGVLLTRKRK